MPASSTESCDPIEQTLQASLDGARQDAKTSASFEKQLLNSAKKVLLSKVEFQPAEKDYTLTLQNLKAKYIHLNPDGNTQVSKMPTTVAGEMNSSQLEGDGIPPPKVVIHPPNKVILGWQRVYRIGAGLANLGNTCFLNAILQCLTYTPPLVNHLIEFNEHVTNCKNVGFCMMCALYRHIRLALEKNGETIKPQVILQKLKAIAKHMVWGRQEDAHEFLRYVMESMIKSSLNGYTTSSLDRISLETTVVNHIFGGYHRSQVICLRCKEKSDTYDHFMDIILDIKSVSSLEKAMEKFVQPEILDNENAYLCPRCKRKCPAQKKFSVHRIPNIATFQFKRFDYNRMVGGKITKHITFPEKLDMRPFMSQRQGHPVVFQLYAVLVHQGSSCNSGHYFCFVRNSNNLWYVMDDCKVRQVSLNFVLSQQAYLLFYTRVPNSSSFTKNVSSAQISSSIHSESTTNGLTPYTSRESMTSSLSKKANTNGTSSAKLKPLIPMASVNNARPLSSNNLLPLPQNRDRVSFGIKSSSTQPQQQQPMTHMNGPKSVQAFAAGGAEGDQKYPRIVMHIKNGKVTSTEQPWTASSGCVLENGPVAAMDVSISPAANQVSNLVPYIPDSSEESDQENRNRMTLCNSSDNGSLHVACDGNGATKLPLTNHSPSTNHAAKSPDSNVAENGPSSKDLVVAAPVDVGAKNACGERNKPLAVVTGGIKAKATSTWVVTDACQQSPSVASEGSNNSINSTTGWTVTDRDDAPKTERQCPGWIVTAKDKKTFFPKERSIAASSSSSRNPAEKIRYFDDDSKLPNRHQQQQPNVRYHSDTETHKPSRKRSTYFSAAQDVCKVRPELSNAKNKCQSSKNDDEAAGESADVKCNSRSSQSVAERENHASDKSMPNLEKHPSNSSAASVHPSSPLKGVQGKNCSSERTMPNANSVPAVKTADAQGFGKVVHEAHEPARNNDSPCESDAAATAVMVNGSRSNSPSRRHRKHKKHRRDRFPDGIDDKRSLDLDSGNSDDSSYKMKRRKKKHKRHHDGREFHRHRHLSDSSSGYELEWVERTKETLEREKRMPAVKYWDEGVNDGYKSSGTTCSNAYRDRVHWDGKRFSESSAELLSQSIHGYGNRVMSWDGNRNQIDRDINSDMKQNYKRHYSDDYDAEYDRGRMKKTKFQKQKYFDSGFMHNPFQRFQDRHFSENKFHQEGPSAKIPQKMYYYGNSSGTPYNSMKNRYMDSKFKYHSNHKL